MTERVPFYFLVFPVCYTILNSKNLRWQSHMLIIILNRDCKMNEQNQIEIISVIGKSNFVITQERANESTCFFTVSSICSSKHLHIFGSSVQCKTFEFRLKM